MEAEIISPSDYVVIPPAGALALTVPEGRALAFFTSPNAVDPVLAAIRKEIDGFSGDVKTAKGRKEIASMAHKISQSKSYLESVGKELAAAQKEIPKKIDASRKQIRDTLDAWRDEVRAPLTEWEEGEQRRVDAHRKIIADLEHAGREPGDCPSHVLRDALDKVELVEVSERCCKEFIADYAAAKDGARARLTAAIADAEKREAEQAELARLRKEAVEREARERDERIAREAAENARLTAERKAAEETLRREAAAIAEKEAIEAKARAAQDMADRREREAALKAEEARLAAERREIDLRRQAEEAERRASEAEARAKREAEEAKAREAAEAAAREADREHRAKINNAAFFAFVAGGIDDDAARLAVTLIAKREIPNVTISY